MSKPPAFQFYAKDWRSSPTVGRMTRSEKGLYIDLMALAWDSEEPGCISLSIEQIAQEFGIKSADLRRFFRKFPGTFQKIGGKFAQLKLAEQAAKYTEISQIRSEAAKKRPANAQQKHQSASASAFASANHKETARAKPARPFLYRPETRTGSGPSDKEDLTVEHRDEYLEFCRLRSLQKLPVGVKTWTQYQQFLDNQRPGWREPKEKANAG